MSRVNFQNDILSEMMSCKSQNVCARWTGQKKMPNLCYIVGIEFQRCTFQQCYQFYLYQYLIWFSSLLVSCS